MTIKMIVAVKGNAKSGNYGHAGRAGKLGGSTPKGKGPALQSQSTGDEMEQYDKMRARIDEIYDKQDSDPKNAGKYDAELNSLLSKSDQLGKDLTNIRMGYKPAATAAGIDKQIGDLAAAARKLDAQAKMATGERKAGAAEEAKVIRGRIKKLEEAKKSVVIK